MPMPMPMSMSSLTAPHLRPRPHSFYSTTTETTGPYISASLGNSSRGVVHRRTSQTYRSSPLAGPVLSYDDTLSALASLDGASASGARKPSVTVSQYGERAAPVAAAASHGLINKESTLRSTQRSTSTGGLAAEYSDDDDSLNLQPPRPVWRHSHSSSRSILTVSSSNSSCLSRVSSACSSRSTRTVSSLISLSIPEVPQPHASHCIESQPSRSSEEQADYSYYYSSGPSSSESSSLAFPSRRHSRLSFAPSPSVSPEVSTSEKQRRRSSLPVSIPTDIHMQNLKHDWLTATPTPVFSRSALRTQSVIMPVSARDRERVRSRCRTESNASSSTAASHNLQVIGSEGNADGSRSRARSDADKADKTRTEDRKPETETETKMANTSSAEENLEAAGMVPETPPPPLETEPSFVRIRRRWTHRSLTLNSSRSKTPSTAAKIARRDTKVPSSDPDPDAEAKDVNMDMDQRLKVAKLALDDDPAASVVDCPSLPKASAAAAADASAEKEKTIAMGPGTKRVKRATKKLKFGFRLLHVLPGSPSLVGVWRRFVVRQRRSS